MPVRLEGRGVVECLPCSRSLPRSTSSSYNSGLDLPSPYERVAGAQEAVGKGGDAFDIFQDMDQQSVSLTRHANSRSPVQTAAEDPDEAHKLGETELGPYHNEARMPAIIRSRISSHNVRYTEHINPDNGQLFRVATPPNEIRNIIPSLAHLVHCASADTISPSTTITSATLCHPCIRHVSKTPYEGGFCGYRNIQTLLSFIVGSNWRHSAWKCITRNEEWVAESTDMLLTILELQELIEMAWDAGINTHCRAQTGGLVDRRVYIGTPELQSLLLAFGIPARAYSVTGEEKPAYQCLIEVVIRHFAPYQTRTSFGLVEEELASGGTLRKTTAPPLFLQQPGHSLTIVGYQVRANGDTSLITLDPGYVTNLAIRRIAEHVGPPTVYGGDGPTGRGWAAHGSSSELNINGRQTRGDTVSAANAEELLGLYRRDVERLCRYREFEVVALM